MCQARTFNTPFVSFQPAEDKSANLSLCFSTKDRDMKDLKKLPCLTSLDLGWTQATDRPISSLLRKLKGLKELSLESSKLKGTCIKYFGTQMRTLNLKACSTLEGQHIQSLSQACPFLRQLNLSDCNLTDESVIAIGCCIKLKSLQLNGNQNVTTSALFQVALNCHEIEILELATLARGVSNELCETIASNMPRLRELNLNSCYNITDQALVSLKACQKLSVLQIAEARNVTNNGIKAISGLPLRHLCIDYCPQITDGILYLKRCGTLEEFSLKGVNRLTDGHILAFFAEMRQCTLKSMNLTSCFNLSQGLIDRIQHRHPSLQFLF
jgi:hypothetical protein